MRYPVFVIRNIENDFEISESRISQHNGFFHFGEAGHPEGDGLVRAINFDFNFDLVFSGANGRIGKGGSEGSIFASGVTFGDHFVEESLIAHGGHVGTRIDEGADLFARNEGVEVRT